MPNGQSLGKNDRSLYSYKQDPRNFNKKQTPKYDVTFGGCFGALFCMAVNGENTANAPETEREP